MKSNKLLGFVRRTSKEIQRTQTCCTFYLSIIQCHLGHTTQVENVQHSETKLILTLPFHCNVTYKSHLQLTKLLPISYRHKFLDIVFFYKAINNLVFVDSEAQPVTRQSMRFTRSSSSNAITYLPQQSRTVTYQHSFFIIMCMPHIECSAH